MGTNHRNRTANPLTLGPRKRPTQRHRPAVWECMLGTVYAANEAGDVRYFDYRWDEALEFAGFSEDLDPRVAKKAENVRYTRGASHEEPSWGQYVLWLRKRG